MPDLMSHVKREVKMESRAFIRTAGALITRLKDTVVLNDEERGALQKDIQQAFQSLQNPTLPSATNLAESAINHGFVVDPKILHRLTQAEAVWGQ